MTHEEWTDSIQPLTGGEIPHRPLHNREGLNPTIANRLIADWHRGRDLIGAVQLMVRHLDVDCMDGVIEVSRHNIRDIKECLQAFEPKEVGA